MHSHKKGFQIHCAQTETRNPVITGSYGAQYVNFEIRWLAFVDFFLGINIIECGVNKSTLC